MTAQSTIETLATVGLTAAVIVSFFDTAIQYKNSQQTSNTAYNTVTNTVYPNDLINSPAGRNYNLTFYFYQYSRPSVNLPVFAAPQGSITLPLPTRLVDSQGITYDINNNGLAFGAAYDAYVKNQGQLGPIVGAAAQGIAATASGNALTTVGNALGVTNSPTTALQIGGLAQNPYLTVLFNQPTFKRHVFTWTFAPLNIGESNKLKYIINKIRYHQLPDVNSATAGTFLNYPDMCYPKITPKGFLYDFKNCVIERMETNFAPGVTPGFHGSSNAPSVITLTISLLEIEIWLKSDLITQDVSSNYSVTTNSQTLQAVQ